MTDHFVLPATHNLLTPTKQHVGANSPQQNTLELKRRALLAASASAVLQLMGCNSSKDKDTVSTTSSINAGVVTTLAGSSITGSVNATGIAASFGGPRQVAVDSSGNVYIADASNNMIRKITAAGVVTTLAGSTTAGYANGNGTATLFAYCTGVAVDSSGNVYVGDAYNYRIRKITSGGDVTTLAGSGTSSTTNGTGTAASFAFPIAVAVDSSGNVYSVEPYANLIRKTTAAGVVTTLAGSGATGSTNGTGTAASFSGPRGIAVDSMGNVYVSETVNQLIRKITAGGVVTTLAGSGSTGSADGTGTAASFNSPYGVAVDSNGYVYVADAGNNMIRKITPGGVVTTFAGSTAAGNANGTGTAATFNDPRGIAVGSTGTLYVADSTNNLIRKIA